MCPVSKDHQALSVPPQAGEHKTRIPRRIKKRNSGGK